MRAIWYNIRTGWNIVRILRLAAALAILVSAIDQNNVPFILVGALFLVFGLVTPGTCCAMYGPPAPNEKTDLNSTNYEELGSK